MYILVRVGGFCVEFKLEGVLAGVPFLGKF